jgi:hypothetical protein
MLEILEESDGNLICFKASGTLTEQDYTEIFELAMRYVLGAHETFRFYADLSVLKDMDENSKWDSGDILAANREKCEKAAVVGGPSWAGLALMLRDSLPEQSYEFFVDGRQDDALLWICE